MFFFHKLPGLLLSVLIAYAGIFLSEEVGYLIGFKKSPISPIIISILLGIVIGNGLRLPQIFNHGFDFATKRVLRLGIILLGIRLSFFDVIYHATIVLPLIIACIGVTLFATYHLSKKIGVGLKFSLLTAIGTSICGATAIVATSPVIDSNKEETAYAIANVTLFGILAMLLYPYLGNLIFAAGEHIGYFMGTSIHETAQVAGAGLIYLQQYHDPIPLDIATITKLIRNSLMLVLIPSVAYVYQKSHQGGTQKVNVIKLFPVFIIGFLATSLFRTLGDNSMANSDSFLGMTSLIWEKSIKDLTSIAELLLTIAMSAIGLNTNVKNLIQLGFKPFLLGMIVALITGLTSLALIFFSIKMNLF